MLIKWILHISINSKYNEVTSKAVEYFYKIVKQLNYILKSDSLGELSQYSKLHPYIVQKKIDLDIAINMLPNIF